MALIEIRNLHKAFAGRAVLCGVNLEIPQGEVTTIIGRSGIGKSVLLKHVIGLLEPDSGSILLEGRDLLQLGRRGRSAVKGRFSYMFQHLALLDSLTVYENIALPLEEHARRGSAGDIRRRVLAMAERMELEDTLAQYPSQLSGGMAKRVAFARALVTDPEIVLFDEPTTGLDPIRKRMVHDMIARHQKDKGFTAVLVSHDIPDVFEVSQQVAMLEDGVIIAAGTPAEIQASENLRVQGFLRGTEGLESGIISV